MLLKSLKKPLKKRLKILSGQKRATIRRGKKDDVSLGPATIGTNTPIVITDISYKLFSELTLTDAQHDGYDNVNELQQALYNFYPDIQPNEYVTLISFELNSLGAGV